MKTNIKNKTVKVKVRNFDILNKPLSDRDKKQIEQAVEKTVREYGEVLRMLGKT